MSGRRIRYNSTRGGDQGRSFRTVVLRGLADDGGLFVPESWPEVATELSRWRNLPFAELAFAVMSLFVDESDVPAEQLRRLLQKSYSTWDVVNVRSITADMDGTEGEVVYVGELFHGPTFSFKDVALQFLGNLFEFLLLDDKEEERKDITILGATSGDTGSAALAGLRGKRNIEVFILHPHGRVSLVQEKQMTTIPDHNVHNVAVEGTFDDCQDMVKAVFNDLAFKRKHNLAAINSINWARILAQIVYYFYCYFQVTSVVDQKEKRKVSFAVPTGNFGNVLAGYYAKRMGLPIHRLIVATNQNDILFRFFETGTYAAQEVQPTITPSMDIQVASNFERFLYHMSQEDAKQVKDVMNEFKSNGKVSVSPQILERARTLISALAITETQTLGTIASIYKQNSYVLCPHSAVGVSAAIQLLQENILSRNTPIICLATAHPAKFPDAVEKAIGCKPTNPPALEAVMHLPSRAHKLYKDADRLKQLMEEQLSASSSSSTANVKHFRIRVPGSSANLGPGFDTFGMALGLFLTVTVTATYKKQADLNQVPHSRHQPKLDIRFSGLGQESAPLNETNLIWTSALHVIQQQEHRPKMLEEVRLEIHNEIPFSRGLGSSGSAAVAGVLLANELLELRLSREELLRYATEIEGHPDNVGASLCGGVVSCCCVETEEGESNNNREDSHEKSKRRVWCNAIPVAAKEDRQRELKAVVIIPEFEVSTAKARKALPPSYPRGDVVYNLQRAVSFVSALSSLDRHRISECLKDKLHQPYRISIQVPGFDRCLALNHLLSSPCSSPSSPLPQGLLGVCLSGSGSTILALAESSYEEVGRYLVDLLSSSSSSIEKRYAVLDIGPAASCEAVTL
ncbi:Threonine synthase [Balamuthia mandrillaris]